MPYPALHTDLDGEDRPPRDSRIVGVDIPFVDMVRFLVKVSLASIPAMIIAFGILTLCAAGMLAFLASIGVRH